MGSLVLPSKISVWKRSYILELLTMTACAVLTANDAITPTVMVVSIVGG